MSYGPDGGAQDARDLAQRAVADVVAVVVVDVLEVVEVHDQQRDLRLQPLGARELARQVHEHEARVRQAGQRVGQRVFLRLLEHDRVVDDGGGLFAHAIEQPAVVVGVAARVDVVDRQRADEPLVEHQRADQRRLQRGRARDAGRFEVGARPRVDQRAAVARHPAGQPEAALHGNLLNHLGVDAGREAAAQRLESPRCAGTARSTRTAPGCSASTR